VSRTLRLASFVLIAAAVALVAAWLLRRPLSEAVVARWFAAQGVPATYRVTALSPNAVTLADVVLGPAAAPDFRAGQVDVQLGWSPFRPRVDRVTLTRPTLRAVLGPRGLSLGSLDRFLPAPGAPATPLPDIDLRLVDARMTLATRAGTVAVTGSGAGRLRGGFAGRFVVRDTQLAASGCAGRLPGATLAVVTTRDAVRVIGDGAAARFACGDRAAVEGLGWHADIRLPPTLDRYTAKLTATTGSARGGGLAAAGLKVVADGAAATLAGPVAGAAMVAARGIAGPSVRAGRATATGNYRFDAATGNATLTAALDARQASIALPLGPLRTVAAQGAGTLVRPLADALAARLAAAARNFDGRGTVTAARRDGTTTGALDGVTLTAATGVRLVQTGRVALGEAGVALDGSLALAGGGLPAAALSGAGRWRRGAATGTGTLTIARWAVPGAAIGASRFVLAATRDGVGIAGNVRVSGALGGGIVATGLGLPVDARIDRGGGIVFGRRCLPVEWAGLTRGDLRLAAGRIVACPGARPMLTLAGARLAGSATIGATALRGTMGRTGFALTATPLRFDLAGATKRPRVALAAVTLAGQFGSRRGRATVEGSFDIADRRGQGRIHAAALDDPGSPVLIDGGAATWRLAGAQLDIAGASARIVDRTAPARFQPLRVADAGATLANGTLRAQGSVRLAATGAPLGRFNARHDIGSGSGDARLDTGRLMFGPALQPYEITESLRGIVANVRGPVVGSGQVEWTTAGIISRGTLRIDTLALATEALGPIDGIAGTIVFDDLLALTTPPGQSLKVARINPGVPVDDGVVVFRLLGPDAAAIASILWPYAGGTLVLAPVTIRAGDVRREFLITVDGLDAQLFLQRFEIKNLNVTGRFDGRLPLIFADGHGRIAGGRLVARPGGGLVQYVGELGSEQVGAAARLAFDALRRLRYRDLTLDLDGDLDGELVTEVHFAGSNEAAATLPGGPLPLKVTGLPFRFGITVRAPFRALLGTASSFSDVRPLLRAPAQSVQPK